MKFESLAEFIHMGAYGLYVWSSFGLTFLIMLALIIEPILTRKSLLTQLDKRAAREQRIKAAQAMDNIL